MVDPNVCVCVGKLDRRAPIIDGYWRSQMSRHFVLAINLDLATPRSGAGFLWRRPEQVRLVGKTLVV